MTGKDEFDLQNFLPYLLNQAAEESSLAFQKVYKSRYGMLRAEWRVLFHLGRYGEMTAKEIGQRARMHKTKISRAVQALSERRFLERRRVERDRRLERLCLTPAGLEAYRNLRAVAEDYDRQLMAQFDAADRSALLRSLRTLAHFNGQ